MPGRLPKFDSSGSGHHFCPVCPEPVEGPFILNSSVEWFVGANLFARSTSYVRMNSHLQKRHNSLKYQNVLRQQRNIGLSLASYCELNLPGAFDDEPIFDF